MRYALIALTWLAAANLFLLGVLIAINIVRSFDDDPYPEWTPDDDAAVTKLLGADDE